MACEIENIVGRRFWPLYLIKRSISTALDLVSSIIWEINAFMTFKRERYKPLRPRGETRQRRRLSINSSSSPEATEDWDGRVNTTARRSKSLYSWVHSLLRLKGRGNELHRQQQSSFFRLPPEVRLQIYSYCLPVERIHIIPLSGKLSCLLCQGDQGDWPKCDCVKNAVSFKRTGSFCLVMYDLGAPVQLKKGTKKGLDGIVNLLLVCRTIYTELVDILYSQPTFHFQQPLALLGLSASIPAHRLSSITKLDLDNPVELECNWSDYKRYVPTFNNHGWDPNQLYPSVRCVAPDLLGEANASGFWSDPFPSALACVRVLSWMTGLRQLRINIPYWIEWEGPKKRGLEILLVIRALNLPNLKDCEVRTGRTKEDPNTPSTTWLRLENEPLRLLKWVGSEWIDEEVL